MTAELPRENALDTRPQLRTIEPPPFHYRVRRHLAEPIRRFFVEYATFIARAGRAAR